jgi:hypothetical protein
MLQSMLQMIQVRYYNLSQFSRSQRLPRFRLYYKLNQRNQSQNFQKLNQYYKLNQVFKCQNQQQVKYYNLAQFRKSLKLQKCYKKIQFNTIQLVNMLSCQAIKKHRKQWINQIQKLKQGKAKFYKLRQQKLSTSQCIHYIGNIR